MEFGNQEGSGSLTQSHKPAVCIDFDGCSNGNSDRTRQNSDDAVPPVFGSLASGVAVTFTTKLLIVGSSLAVSIIVARCLGPEGTGALGVLNVTVALALQLGSAGIPSAATYFVATDQRLLGPVGLTGTIFSMVTGMLIAIGVSAIANLRPTLFNGLPPRLISIAVVAIPFQLITLLALNLLLAIDRIRLMNALEALSSLLILANSVFVLVLWRHGLTLLVVFNTASAAAVCLLMVWNIRPDARQRRQREAARPGIMLLRKMVAYGLKFYISICAMFMIFRADLLIVNYFRGADAAGVYAIASQFTFLLIMLPGVIASLLFPRVAGRRENPAAYTVDVTRHTSFVMLIICIAAAAAAFALPLVYGPRFSDATKQLLIMLPGTFFIALESVLVQHFTGTGLPPIIPAFWIITVIVNLGLNLALVPVWGARAAAVNSSVSYALIFFMVAAYFCRRNGHNILLIIVPRVYEFKSLLVKWQRRAFAK